MVPKKIAQQELRDDTARVIDAVVAGESFVIVRNGEPVAQLRPIGRKRQTFVSRAKIASAAMQSPHIDAAAFRHDLGRLIDQSS